MGKKTEVMRVPEEFKKKIDEIREEKGISSRRAIQRVIDERNEEMADKVDKLKIAFRKNLEEYFDSRGGPDVIFDEGQLSTVLAIICQNSDKREENLELLRKKMVEFIEESERD